MTDSDRLSAWSVRAVNLDEHADNPIHTDIGARAAGYPAAIVAGTTVYAYLTRPPVDAWGRDWIVAGGGELRLRRAVLDGDLVESGPSVDGRDDITIEARVGGEAKATFDVWRHAEAPAMRDGDPLPDLDVELDDTWGRYGVRCGDDHELYRAEPLAHPAIWPSLANRLFKDHLVTGSWIHTRSRIVHQGAAVLGDSLRIRSNVVERFETRAGKRAIVDIAVTVADEPVAMIEHEALIELNDVD